MLAAPYSAATDAAGVTAVVCERCPLASVNIVRAEREKRFSVTTTSCSGLPPSVTEVPDIFMRLRDDLGN